MTEVSHSHPTQCLLSDSSVPVNVSCLLSSACQCLLSPTSYICCQCVLSQDCQCVLSQDCQCLLSQDCQCLLSQDCQCLLSVSPAGASPNGHVYKSWITPCPHKASPSLYLHSVVLGPNSNLISYAHTSSSLHPHC